MATPLEEFFAQFSNLGFEYRGNTSAHQNFERLQHVSGWGEGTPRLRKAINNFNDALTRQFNVTIGVRTDLASWQNLCTLIDITPVPNSIGDCQRRVRDSHVNIVDLLESVRTGKPVRKFPTLKELCTYTLKTGRIFPKQSAYAGGLLKELLREIFKYGGKKENGEGGKKRKKRRARKRAAAAAAAAAAQTPPS